ncbi:unnamed protein product [Arctia plantaginis]|uniref:Peptidase S1 domain-containing protein n=1 Tax=Arctia plantaginis TaxID=874455 RepID=A0A8S1B6W1_ARCPL|nr:unnamed protein product [Arctia plantaginis]CAB3255408.1 unnamed protein product [Arctia plantaginis]
MMRPPYVTCAVEMKTKEVCVWSAGAALVSRDSWGRWQLLGVGVRGPGCGAPSRYLDMMSYYPWIENSLSKFREFTISKLNPHKYVLRYAAHETSGGISPELVGKRLFERFGACDAEEKENLLYREVISMRTNHQDEQSVKYNLTITENVEFTCLTVELINASATSEMRIIHECPRAAGGASCYRHQSSEFELSIIITFGDTCLFELAAWGHKVSMDFLDIHEWKWREGEYYPDFNMQKVEYRGTSDMTGFGFEPLDRSEWVPEYDLWTTTLRQEPSSTVPPLYCEFNLIEVGMAITFEFLLFL